MEILINKNTNSKYETETTTIKTYRPKTGQEVLDMVADRLAIGDRIRISTTTETGQLDAQSYPIAGMHIYLEGIVVKVPRKQELRLQVETENGKYLRDEKVYINL